MTAFTKKATIKPKTPPKSITVAPTIPDIPLRTYEGGCLGAKDYVEYVLLQFQSYGVSRFLKDPDACKKEPDWSEAFAAKIRTSIKGDRELGYIVIVNDTSSCQQLYKTLCNEVSSHKAAFVPKKVKYRGIFDFGCGAIKKFKKFYNDFQKYYSTS